MAEHVTHPAPPRAVLWLLRVAAPSDGVADALIGDFCESYAMAAHRSPARARWWCWREATASAAYLLAERADTKMATRLLVLVCTVLAAQQIARVADTTWAPRATELLANATGPFGSVVARYLVEMSGVAAGALLVGGTSPATRPIQDPRRVVARGLPLLILLLAPAVLATAAGPDGCSPLWFSLWSTMVVLALAVGMLAGQTLRGRLSAAL